MNRPDRSAPPTSTVTVIVPAQRAGTVLEKQLDALSSQADAPDFSVVVVLAADDPGAAIVEGYRDRLSISSVTAPMVGAAAARNAGVASSSGSILLFCDADDVVGEGWVGLLAGEVERHGVAGSAMRVEWENCPAWARPFYEPLDDTSLQLFYGTIPFVVSASMGVSRELFEAVGGFDEGFPGAGGEEVDFCYRVIEHVTRTGGGSSIEFGTADDDAAIVRYLPRSTFRSIARQRVGYSRGAARIIVKHGLEGIGTVESIDQRHLRTMARSPRRLLIVAWSFVVLRRELRMQRRMKSSAAK